MSSKILYLSHRTGFSGFLVSRLSSAQRVIVIGHGPGCRSLIHLVNKRSDLCLNISLDKTYHSL